jgi:hypothetical protein
MLVHQLSSLKLLAKEFFLQGAPKLFVGQCCGRIYIGVAPAVKCRTCNKSANNAEIFSIADLDTL